MVAVDTGFRRYDNHGETLGKGFRDGGSHADMERAMGFAREHLDLEHPAFSTPWHDEMNGSRKRC
jgi:hypothetical protein